MKIDQNILFKNIKFKFYGNFMHKNHSVVSEWLSNGHFWITNVNFTYKLLYLYFSKDFLNLTIQIQMC